ncbi:hypothetical protein DPMN_139958 [Dreissena polymorpha]|uniref:Uncharacterized protein n=1 Tax=Dreissena polymorpha TaxID=45954 RepID=A0A9D4JJX8_DREPO|nr:hypothetical protein DPMN_139958 [Dreissena polymorpha]
MWPLEKNAPPLGDHVFQANIIILELTQEIIETNLLTKCHEDWTINVASRVLTRKNARPWWPYIIGTNLLTKFHDDRNINVTSRVHMMTNAPPPGGHVFQPTGIIFELVQDNIGMNLLTNHIKKNAPPLGSHVFSSKLLTGKNAPPHGGHVFQPKGVISELVQNIIGMNLLTNHIKKAPPLGSNFHEDRKINVASRVLTRKNDPPPGGRVFQPTGIIFELVQDIIKMNILNKFHEDQTINVASRVKNAPPLGSHVFQANVTIFELIQYIIETNLLTKFHEDWTINVASRE